MSVSLDGLLGMLQRQTIAHRKKRILT